MANITDPTAGTGEYAGTEAGHSGGSLAYCDRCGARYDATDLRPQRGVKVCDQCYDEPERTEHT